MLFLSVDDADHSICEFFPTTSLMRTCLMLAHGEGGVEQKHTLLGPTGEVATGGNGGTSVVLYLLEDVEQRRGKRHSVVDRETQSMGLTWLMIGILSQKDYLQLLEWTEIEGIENQTGGRIALVLAILLPDERHKLSEVRLVELALQPSFPALLYFHFHVRDKSRIC